jgi:uncharacterized membrane protein YidH (DUF202 family)
VRRACPPWTCCAIVADVDQKGKSAMPNQQVASPTNTEPAQERTGLADFRTKLALDRTTLAWIRTSLSLTTFGFGTVGFFRTLRDKAPSPVTIHAHESAITFGVALIVVGTVVSMLVAISHGSALRKLNRNETPDLAGWSLSISLSWLLAILGLVSLWLMFGAGRGGPA